MVYAPENAHNLLLPDLQREVELFVLEPDDDSILGIRASDTE